MWRNYSDRQQLGIVRFIEQHIGYVFLCVGIFMAFFFNFIYLIEKLELITLDHEMHHECIHSPPSNRFLAALLASKRTTEKAPISANPFASGAPSQQTPVECEYILGGNRQGKDMFSLMVEGSGSFALPGLLAVFIATFLGIISGVIDGYMEGISSWIVKKLIHLIHAVPRLLLLIIVGIISDFNMHIIMICLGILNFPKIAQSISNRIRNLKQQQFIEAAVELGLSKWSIVTEQILWANCRYIIFIQAAFGMADAIFTETTLSYLQLGANERSWGWLLAEGVDHLTQGVYWTSAIPAFGVVITIMGYYLIGDGLSLISRVKK